jgi:hypothetical protein
MGTPSDGLSLMEKGSIADGAKFSVAPFFVL